MSYTLAQLRKELAKTLGCYVSGTATSGSTTTVVDTSLLDSGEWADDHFNGSTIYIVDTTDDAAPKGEARFITDFTQSSGTITVGKAFTAAPDASDEFEIYTIYTVDELNTALMLAVEDWRLHTTLSLTDTAAEYSLTAEGLHEANQVIAVSLRDSSDTDQEFKVISDWRVWDDGGTLTIEFADDAVDASSSARIEYLAKYDQLSASGVFGAAYDDAQVVGGDLWMHILKAQSHLYRIKMNYVTGADLDRYTAFYREAEERLEREMSVSRRRPGRAKNSDDFYQGETGRRYQARDWYL